MATAFEIPYIALRVLHLLLVTAIIPAGLYHYFRVQGPMPDSQLWPSLVYVFFLSVLLVGLDQFGYPLTLTGALSVTGYTLIHIALTIYRSMGAPSGDGVGAVLSESAYNVFLPYSACGMLFFLGGAAMIAAMGLKEWKDPEFSSLLGVFTGIFLVYAIVAVISIWFTWKLTGPVWKNWAALASKTDRAAFLGGLLAQFGVLAWNWFNHIAPYNGGPGASAEYLSKQQKSFEAWGLGIVLSMIATVLAALIVTGSHTETSVGERAKGAAEDRSD